MICWTALELAPVSEAFSVTASKLLWTGTAGVYVPPVENRLAIWASLTFVRMLFCCAEAGTAQSASARKMAASKSGLVQEVGGWRKFVRSF